MSVPVDSLASLRWLFFPRQGAAFVRDQSATIDDHNEPRPDVIVAPADYLQQSPFPIKGAQLVVEVVSPTAVPIFGRLARRASTSPGEGGLHQRFCWWSWESCRGSAWWRPIRELRWWAPV